jgi:hypothetical protein
MATNILQLAELINQSVKTLVKTCEDNKLPLPSLNDPFTIESETFRTNPACAYAANVILAAATQLSATVASPQMAAMGVVTGVRHFLFHMNLDLIIFYPAFPFSCSPRLCGK